MLSHVSVFLIQVFCLLGLSKQFCDCRQLLPNRWAATCEQVWGRGYFTTAELRSTEFALRSCTLVFCMELSIPHSNKLCQENSAGEMDSAAQCKRQLLLQGKQINFPFPECCIHIYQQEAHSNSQVLNTVRLILSWRKEDCLYFSSVEKFPWDCLCPPYVSSLLLFYL